MGATDHYSESGECPGGIAPQPTPAPTATPARPAATPRPVAVATPTPGVPVPDLRGLNREIAEKTAAASGFQLQVGYENTNALNQQAQQSAPPDLRVIRQTPEPKKLAPPKTTINV